MATFYIQKRSTVRSGWRLMQESQVNGKRSQKSVPKTAWLALGFSDSMTIEQARARAKQLNSQNRIQRQEAAQIVRIAERVERDQFHHSVFIPKDLNEAFIRWLDDNSSGGEVHREKLKVHWATAKKTLIALKLLPENYASNKKRFYRHFAEKGFSLDYAKKLISMINQYGTFTSRLRGRFYDPIPMPKGHDRELINDRYFASKRYRGPSDRLTPELLEGLKSKLPEAQYNWLYVTVWLGLRPSEVDMIAEDRLNKFWRVEDGEPDVLWVYQAKLTAKPRDLRWKLIPIIYPEQREAISLIYKGNLSRPLVKTIKKHLPGRITLYGGRKGFTDLMLGLGQPLEFISQWLGHSSIRMTWAVYKDRLKVHSK